jgi:ubiquinone/menaquinone biosynthesis C-methylase UbiE
MSDASQDVARRRAHMPEGTSRFLNTRSLATAQRRLAELLRPGMAVLDVGCGSGAITRGIAEAVAPGGRVVGIDINPGLIAEARRTHADMPGLTFEVAEVERFADLAGFDVVTAARVLQWLANPLGALWAMVALAKSGGRVLVLDYNHEKIAWRPDPPPSFRAFYAAFLRWRAEAGMDNAIADHLAAMFADTGLAWRARLRDAPGVVGRSGGHARAPGRGRWGYRRGRAGRSRGRVSRVDARDCAGADAVSARSRGRA